MAVRAHRSQLGSQHRDLTSANNRGTLLGSARIGRYPANCTVIRRCSDSRAGCIGVCTMTKPTSVTFTPAKLQAVIAEAVAIAMASKKADNKSAAQAGKSERSIKNE